MKSMHAARVALRNTMLGKMILEAGCYVVGFSVGLALRSVGRGDFALWLCCVMSLEGYHML